MAAQRVIETGSLSDFLGCYQEEIFGGTSVKALESKFSKKIWSQARDLGQLMDQWTSLRRGRDRTRAR